MTVTLTEAIIDKNKTQERESKIDNLGRSYATGKRKIQLLESGLRKVKVKLLSIIKIYSNILAVKYSQ